MKSNGGGSVLVTAVGGDICLGGDFSFGGDCRLGNIGEVGLGGDKGDAGFGGVGVLVFAGSGGGGESIRGGDIGLGGGLSSRGGVFALGEGVDGTGDASINAGEIGVLALGDVTSGGDFIGGSCLMNPVYGCLDSGSCCVSGGNSVGGGAADLGGKLGTKETGEITPGFVGWVGLVINFGGVISLVGGVGDRFEDGVEPWVEGCFSSGDFGLLCNGRIASSGEPIFV